MGLNRDVFILHTRYDNAMTNTAEFNRRPKPEMIEGPQAFERFERAVKTVLAVPKGAIPSPFGHSHRKKKPVVPKG